MKQYAIFSNDISNKPLIEQIFQYFAEKVRFLDCHIFTDNQMILGGEQRATLSPFYMPFYKGNLIFLNIQDFLSSKENIIASKVYLYASADELLDSNIDKRSLNNAFLLSHNNGHIYEV